MRKLLLSVLLCISTTSIVAQPLNNTKVDGYRGIWFTLGQESEYGYKYSGGLATYTIKHNPIAIYAAAVDKTFFVYGGTTSAKEKHLLCMIGCYDHRTGKVQKPVVVFDKEEVIDPHDNPAMQIDADGYLWVFVSGRGGKRMGHIYRSDLPYDIASFTQVKSWYMTYPQPMYIPSEGFFLCFTKYTGVRRLYYATSADGREWSDVFPLADIKEEGDTKSGHYQVSASFGNKIVTCFNRHKNGNVDTRTNMYYLQTVDMGRTWTTADGRVVETPVTELNSPALVVDAQSEGKNLYVKDINFDEKGNPVVLYLTSGGHRPGPANNPRQWYVGYWNGREWRHYPVTTSDHNYDSGSIWTDGGVWTVIAPTDDGPQRWQTGGEIVMWRSRNKGKSWRRVKNLTDQSRYNHGYVRRPIDAHDPFYAFWADGNPERLTQSHLYFADSAGNVYRLPYDMTEEWQSPEKVKEVR